MDYVKVKRGLEPQTRFTAAAWKIMCDSNNRGGYEEVIEKEDVPTIIPTKTKTEVTTAVMVTKRQNKK